MGQPLVWNIGITPLAIAGCLAAAGGLYFLFVGQRNVPRVVGAAGAGIGLALLWSEFNRASEWWGQLHSESIADSPLFAVCGLAAIVTAGLTVTAKRATVAAAWFLSMLCCTAALFALHDAQFLATTTLLVGAGSAAPCLLLAVRRLESTNGTAESTQPHEPLLACLCGGLLAATLLGTVQRTLTAAEDLDASRLPAVVERWQERATKPVGHRAIVSTEPQATQAGLSMFADHPVALLLLTVISLIAIVMAVLVVRGAGSPSVVSLRRKRSQSDGVSP